MKLFTKILCAILVFCLLIPAVCFLSGCGTSEVKTYDELVSAINGNKGTIKLSNDINVTSTLVIERSVTLNLNGKKLYNENDIWDKNPNDWSIISVRKNGNLTINGSGTIDCKENDCYAIDVMDGGKAVIENGNFIGNISAVYAYEGNVEIKGGTYSIKQKNNNKVEREYGLTINIYNENGAKNLATISITGGTFNNFDPADKTDNKDNLVAKGYKTELIENTTNYRVVKDNNM